MLRLMRITCTFLILGAALNPSFVEELPSSPTVTPVQLARYVQRNRPVVLRGYGRSQDIVAVDRWTTPYLRQKLGQAKLKIAATPSGNADSLVDGLFVEPACTFSCGSSIDVSLAQTRPHTDLEMDIDTFLDKLACPQSDEVLYLQSQNDNLHNEMKDLLADAGEDLPIATEVFGDKPDAVNVWIGDDRSVTSLHKGTTPHSCRFDHQSRQ